MNLIFKVVFAQISFASPPILVISCIKLNYIITNCCFISVLKFVWTHKHAHMHINTYTQTHSLTYFCIAITITILI